MDEGMEHFKTAISQSLAIFFIQHLQFTKWRLKNIERGLTFKGSTLSSECNVPSSILEYFLMFILNYVYV